MTRPNLVAHLIHDLLTSSGFRAVQKCEVRWSPREYVRLQYGQALERSLFGLCEMVTLQLVGPRELPHALGPLAAVWCLAGVYECVRL